jgi:hypothetical protein
VGIPSAYGRRGLVGIFAGGKKVPNVVFVGLKGMLVPVVSVVNSGVKQPKYRWVGIYVHMPFLK